MRRKTPWEVETLFCSFTAVRVSSLSLNPRLVIDCKCNQRRYDTLANMHKKLSHRENRRNALSRRQYKTGRPATATVYSAECSLLQHRIRLQKNCFWLKMKNLRTENHKNAF